LPPNAADLPATCADLTKARRLLGYQPQIPIAEAIREFAVWLRQEDAWTRQSHAA
jgi:UDP-glucuronate 4-epimerase